MKKFIVYVFCILFIGLSVDFAFAKGGSSSGGGGRSSSSSFSSGSRSSSSSSSSFSSGSKSASATPSSSSGFSSGSKSSSSSSAAVAPSSNTGFSSGSKPAVVPSKTFASSPSATTPQAKSSFVTNTNTGIKSADSKAAVASYNSKFAKPTNPVSTVKMGGGNSNYAKFNTHTYTNNSAYMRDRGNYYSSRGWNAPNYVYMSSPSFGFWDGMMLWMMLDNMNHHSFYYHHQNDEGLKAWRAEADKLAKDNAELKKKLDTMDGKVKELEKSGTLIDVSYVPADIDPKFAVAQEIAVQEEDEDSGMGFFGWMMVILFTCIAGWVIIRIVR